MFRAFVPAAALALQFAFRLGDLSPVHPDAAPSCITAMSRAIYYLHESHCHVQFGRRGSVQYMYCCQITIGGFKKTATQVDNKDAMNY